MKCKIKTSCLSYYIFYKSFKILKKEATFVIESMSLKRKNNTIMWGDWRMIKYLIIFLLFFFNGISAYGQYFGGPNKPGYKVIDYKVYTSPNFEIYHYFENDSIVKAIALSAEKWYQRHLMIFKDTFKSKNPLIIYADHADFQQTNAIMGMIGVGTGGVTEALKNRVIMPVMESAAQTDHVLGHELVHAFQYHILLGEDSLQLRNIRNIPLWMIEGMAEYLSIGSTDSHTAMWMRDALLNNDFPTLDDMTRSYKYFPYRYGQAFWTFVTGIYGDTIIKPLFDLTTLVGYERALDSLVHVNEKTFSSAWKATLKDYYFPLLKDTVEKPNGSMVLSKKNSGTVNIAPSLSPDGKHVMFLSEKDLFTFDLFIAEAKTGKRLKKVTSTIRDNQIDDFNYLESGGSWSPDGRYFTFVTFSKGRNRLLVVDTKRRRNVKEHDIKGVSAFSNPTWSPDGKSIVVTGLVNGVSDLYRFYPEKEVVENITKDSYCNLMASWSPDGKKIVFSTDRPVSGKDAGKGHDGYNIAVLDLETSQIEVIPVFEGAENLNPVFSPDGSKIYFLSNSDGYRNLYTYIGDSSKVYRLTELITGISGITKFTPAITIDRNEGNIIYTHFWKSEYNLHFANDSSFKYVEVDEDSLDFTAAILPALKRTDINIIDDNLRGAVSHKAVPADSLKAIPYKPKFQLDYIGGSNVGVGVSSYYGTGVAGSVDMLFSDIVGDYQMYSSLAINGEIYDFAGSVAFINNKYKIDWGAGLSHIPYRYGYYSRGLDSLEGKQYETISLNYHRIFEDAISLFAIRPISQTRRLELQGSFSFYSQRLDKYTNYYDGNSYRQKIERNLPTEAGFGIFSLSTAYTLDNAFMGIASPLRGQRFRAEIGWYSGYMDFYSLTLDFRKYYFFKPVCLAFRLYHQGRYGNESTNYVIRSLYLGWPWLVRGFYSFSPETADESELSQLYGSRIAISNFEIRVPFTGPERLCLIPFKYLFTELSFFVDAGIAWNSYNKLTLDRNANKNQPLATTTDQTINVDRAHFRYPMVSYGISLRINMFGYMVLEPYYAFIARNGAKATGLSLNFMPGW